MIRDSFRHVMLDVETLGTRPGSVILSIGAVPFDHFGIHAEDGARFYHVISTRSCIDAGFVADPETLEWWQQQQPSARVVVDQAKVTDNRPGAWRPGEIGDVLTELRNHVAGRYVWANGADFDLPIIAEAYRRCGLGPAPWSHKMTRCYRTIRALRQDVEFESRGDAHNALQDAMWQALHASRILNAMGGSAWQNHP